MTRFSIHALVSATMLCVVVGCGSSGSGNQSGAGGNANSGGAPACALGSYQFPTGPTYTTKSGSSSLSRITTWKPGIEGGVPKRTTVCKTLSATGNADDVPINDAISACPANQVVMLNPGVYNITSTIYWGKSDVVLRGSGGPGVPAAAQTRLMADASLYGPVVAIGPSIYPNLDGPSTNCTTDATQGTNSVSVSSTTGLNVGDLVVIDITVDPADDTGAWILDAPAGTTGLTFPYAEYSPNSPKGDESRAYFNRMDRPTSQLMEVQSITGNTVTFSTPFHITFDVAHTAQITQFTYDGPTNKTPLNNAGLEDLYVAEVPGGGASQNDNVVLTLAKNSWIRNVESDQSQGVSIGLDYAFHCVVRDSYMHSTVNPTPGGAGYGLSFSGGSADNLIENNISWNFDKVMVMRAGGGGNVIAYNYMDDGWIQYQPAFVESGMNASHSTMSHFELFEGNLTFSLASENTWGNATFITWLRNLATAHRSAWPPLNTFTYNVNTDTSGCKSGGAQDYVCIPYTDGNNRMAVAMAFGHVFYNFVGNVLGYGDMPTAPMSGFTYESKGPDFPVDPVPMWMVGFDGNSTLTDQGVVNTLFRDGNYDYATKSIHWTGAAQTVPNSLYLCNKPAFFGSYSWPWVDGSNATTPYATHPFQYYPLSPTLGTYGTSGALVTYSGFQLPAYVRFLQMHGIEQPPTACSTATLASVPSECSIVLTGVAP